MITIQAEDLRLYARARTRTEPRHELLAWFIANQTELLARFEVTTPERWAMFIAQVAHETGGFRIIEENLNYSATRLCEVWPNRFPSLSVARKYAGDPERLGNYVYARKDLGNVHPGDGYLFRGRGGEQITGRACYAEIGALLGRDLVGNPEQVAHDPELWWLTAFTFWKSRNLNACADARDIRKCTLRINGGLNGFEDRKGWYEAAWSAWGDGGDAPDAYDPTLELHDAGTRVEALQRRLSELRYPVGALDGRFGKLTQAAVLAFQKESGLAVDGVVGANTEAALAKALPRDLGARTLTDAADLAAAGSRIVGGAETIKTVAETTTGTALAVQLADASGATDWMRQAADGAGAFNTLLSGLSTGMKLVSSNLWIAVPLLGAVAWMIASQLIKARVADHQAAANLNK